MQNILLFLTIAYYLACAIYFVVTLLKKNERKHFLCFLFCILLPFSGAFILLVSVFRIKNRDKDLNYYGELLEDENPLFISDTARDLNAASVTDILLFNDISSKREVLMDLFRRDSAQYVKELRLALNDDDTEISHYASTALTEIKRKYDNAIISMSRLANDNEDNAEYQIQYAEALFYYIESDILDRSNKTKYQETFCRLTESFYEQRLDEHSGMKMELYKAFLLYLRQLGKADKAVEIAENMLTIFENDIIFFAVLELYYDLEDREHFFNTVERLKLSRIRLPKEKLASLRFFLGTMAKEEG